MMTHGVFVGCLVVAEERFASRERLRSSSVYRIGIVTFSVF